MLDVNQTVRMIEWLDEERRRDKALIAALQERLTQQQDVIDLLTRRITSLENDQAGMQSQVASKVTDADLLEQMRREMATMLENIEAKRLTAEREAERRAELMREQVLRTVREVGEKTEKLQRQTTELPAIGMEADRLAATVSTLAQRLDDLYKRLEEPDRRLVFLEEQRRTDARRLTELEGEQPDMRKALEAMRPKLTLLEDLAIRTERRVVEVQNAERERREQMQQFNDQQTLLLQQRDQQVNELARRFSEQETLFQRNMERFELWVETYRAMKKVLDDFERIGDRLERRISEVAEMQRLSEERFRAEWNDYRGEDTRRWKQFTVSADEAWRLHDREFERYVARMGELEALLTPLIDAINRLWNLERQRAALYRDRYQELLLEFDTGSMPPITPNGSSMP